MNVAAGLIASRFVHYLALSVLFGGALFPFYGMASRAGGPRIPSWLALLLRLAAWLTFLSALSWLLFTAANMSGNVSGMTDPGVLSLVLLDTGFGRVWAVRLVLAAGLAVLMLGGGEIGRRRHYVVLAGALLLLTSIALTGHAGSDTGRFSFLHRAADAIHLIAAGVWIGALIVFSRMVLAALHCGSATSFHYALAQFSGTGTAAVVALVATGLINPGFLASLSTPYGRLLLAKLGMFGCMLMLAAVNRFWLTPRLALALHSGTGLGAATGLLRASMLIETALALLVLLSVAWLGTLAPP